jgi:hypothetical protein
MHQPMTPIELLASAFTIIATGALIWWGLSHLISGAVELYERCRPMREEQERKNG